MDETESRLRQILDWVAEHDDDANNAAIDLQILLDSPGHGLEADAISDALFDDEAGFDAVEVVDPQGTATGLLLLQLHWRIKIVRKALPAYRRAHPSH